MRTIEDENKDSLTAEELAAAAGGAGNDEVDTDRQHQIDRGDFFGDEDDLAGAGDGGGTGEGDGAGAGAGGEGEGTGGDDDPLKGAGEGDGAGAAGADDGTDLDALSTIAGIADEDAETAGKPPSGMPFSRANEISREKNAAADLVTALLAGTVDKRWVADMGGQQAVVKAVAAGKLVLPAHPGGEDGGTQLVVHPEIAKLETNLDELNKQLAEATVNVDSEKMLSLQKQINSVNRQIIKVENNLAYQAEVERNRREAAIRDEANVQMVMKDLWSKHPELHTDTNEYLAFMTRRDKHLQKGEPMSKALQLAAQETFTQSSAEQPGKKTAEQIAAERLANARKKGAEASAAQPPAGQGGAGTRGTETMKSIEKLSDEEFDKLSEEEKAKVRGDNL